LAERTAALGLAQGSLIDLAYRIRENDHPEYGGIEVEIAGIEPAGSGKSDPERSEAHG
jgi:single-stranded-DNA-specific exonuclease